MLSETVIRRLEALGEISKQEKPINGLFRLLENPILWNEAYANVRSQLNRPIPKISEPACYGRQKREGNPSTCLNWRRGMREEKHESQAEDESYLARVSVHIRLR